MKATKLTILARLAIAATAWLCPVVAEAKPILYHWIDERNVILWQSPSDEQPVMATLDPQSKKWNVEPKESAGAWRPILDKIVRFYHSEVDTGTLSEDQLWSSVLAKLNNEYEGVMWAEERTPDVEIYLTETPPQSARVGIVYKKNDKPDREIIEFTLQDNKWVKQQDLDLNRLFGIDIGSGERRKILEIPSNTLSLPNNTATWEAAWNEWINRLLDPNEARIRQIMYLDKDKQLKWLWRERLSPGSEFPTRIEFRRISATAPPYVYDPLGGDKPPSNAAGSNLPFGLWVSMIFNLILVVGIVLVFRFRKALPSPPDWLPDSTNARWTNFARSWEQDSQRQAISFFVSIFEDLHNQARERYAKKLQAEEFKNDPGASVILNSVQFAHELYGGLIADYKSEHKVAAYRDKVVADYFRELKIAEGNTDEIKQLIESGRVAQEAESQLSNRRRLIPEEVKKLLPPPAKVWPPKEDGILKYSPYLVDAYNVALENLHKKCDRLQQELNERDATQGRTSSEIQKLSSENKSLKSDIADLKRKFDIEQKEKQAALKDFETARLQIRDIQSVKRLSSNLRRWLQGYYEKENEKMGEIRPVALLGTLINFSLCQLCFSIAEDNRELRKAVAHNILKFTLAYDGKHSDFEETRKALEELAPGVNKALDGLKDGGSALDSTMFRGFLGRLTQETGKQLGRFIIEEAVEKNGKFIFVTGN